MPLAPIRKGEMKQGTEPTFHYQHRGRYVPCSIRELTEFSKIGCERAVTNNRSGEELQSNPHIHSVMSCPVRYFWFFKHPLEAVVVCFISVYSVTSILFISVVLNATGQRGGGLKNECNTNTFSVVVYKGQS